MAAPALCGWRGVRCGCPHSATLSRPVAGTAAEAAEAASVSPPSPSLSNLPPQGLQVTFAVLPFWTPRSLQAEAAMSAGNRGQESPMR